MAIDGRNNVRFGCDRSPDSYRFEIFVAVYSNRQANWPSCMGVANYNSEKLLSDFRTKDRRRADSQGIPNFLTIQHARTHMPILF